MSVALSARNAQLLLKLETTEGTDAAPTGVDAVLVSNLSWSPLEGSEVSLDYIRSYWGNSPSLKVEEYITFSFEVDIAGGGMPLGTAPKWGVPLQATAWAEVLTAATNVKYNPISGGVKTITAWYNVGGVKHAAVGCKGTVSFEMQSGGRPVMKFNFTGKYVPPVDAAAVTGASYAGWQQPVAVTTLNTSGLIMGKTLGCGASELAIAGFSLDMAVDVKHKSLIGCSKVMAADRKPKGSISLQMTNLAVVDWFDEIRKGNKHPFELTLGTTPGNIVKFDIANAQLANPKYSDSDGMVMLDCDIIALPGATGNDEVIITCT